MARASLALIDAMYAAAEAAHPITGRGIGYKLFVANLITSMAISEMAFSRRVPLSYKVLLPAYSDELAHDLGLIDTDLSLEDARHRFRINDRAERFADDPEFSTRIRGSD